MEMWENKFLGTFWATPGLLWDSYNFSYKNVHVKVMIWKTISRHPVTVYNALLHRPLAA